MGFLRLALLFLIASAAATSAEDKLVVGRPDPNDVAAMARWLVSRNLWGVLSTMSIHLQGIPFGNIVSFSDGPPGNSSGTPYFYLTKLDPTAFDLSQNPNCSLAISEEPLGTCMKTDAEDPRCAKITLSGQIFDITAETDRKFAADALFSKHPEMKDWPTDHNFSFYGLVIKDIFLLDWFGGPKPITVADYFKARAPLNL